ncbi:hypothetical protein G4177_01625 [Corallococcus sp. ZKHCc1 1396]|uniref:(2Fe-2S) ferredoxin domain-containing protein n=1 Tax=Corallococcus soli TaxID=2710757 RepID=A0ABR9PG28_9BACT|nr:MULTISPECIES: hypothetical protein [Corallococcus]MBE4746871.1 hypothetical protein [Corallococcus soli]MCY1030422.1 hypothetical protein [Corallococcus sp. BB11-1]RYY94784.1 MAG: hypothetical protein EOO24_24095 [Comamonadaceae bacterium]
MTKRAPPSVEHPDPTEVHLCYRCLVRLPVEAGGADLPRRVREALKTHGLANRTQLIPASCLGHCPTGLVTTLVVPDATAKGTHAKLIDPVADGEDLAQHLKQVLAKAGRP